MPNLLRLSCVPHRQNYRILLLCLLAVGLDVTAQAQTVRKVAEPFEAQSWVTGDDSSAGGNAQLVTGAPNEIAATSKQALQVEADFSGNGFEFFRAAPPQPLIIPGNTKSVSVWVRSDSSNYGWNLVFKDGWGRSEVNGQKLQWEVTKGVQNNWQQVNFKVPADWVQPLTIDSVFVHNWDAKTTKGSIHLWLDELRVETDISDVDPQTGVLRSWNPNPAPAKDAKDAATPPITPLLTANLATTQLHNVFSGMQPAFLLQARNWKGEAGIGTLTWKLSDYRGATVREGKQDLKVEDNLAVPLPLPVSLYGLYKLDSTLSWQGDKSTQSSQPLAYIPVPRELSDAEKDASPYGLNVLGARQPMVETFRKAGIIWYRDYGFNYEWMVRAKGADKSYGGWPWYPKMVRQYDTSGVRVLANLQTAIKPPAGDKIGPDLNWTREIAGILMAFPSLRAFELDNEYDLGGEHVKAEVPINWANYRSYHKKFGDIARLLGDGQWTTVENGRAGIWPNRLRDAVQSGDYANIGVVNSHHYTGLDPPEINTTNHNMGSDNVDSTMLFFDQLRAAKQAGSSDGKPRQHWLTEFGWDTKAGPVVTPVEQAAYLQRAFMLLAAAGTSKGFWFFDLDAPTANQFFDGCGLFTYDQLPKLSYAAYAGMTQILPKPEYIGMINAGDGTWGYLFREEGKLVAALWSVTGEQTPRVIFEGAKLYDFLANPLAGSAAQPGLTPVYAVGVAENSRWARQASYSLESPYLVAVTAGDSVTTNLHVKNARATAINGKVRLVLPTGWQDASGEKTISVAPGQTTDRPLTFRISNDEPLGEKTIHLAISEGEPLHEIPLRVQIQRPILMTVRGPQGQPGAGEVTIRLSNRSTQTLDGALHFTLPASWHTAAPELPVAALKPKETREITAKVDWTPNWKENETATVEYASADGRKAQQPLIPPQLTIHHASQLTLDGDLKDWPANTRLPSWVLGTTAGTPNSDLHLAWSEQGLYVGLQIHDSKVLATDPRSFWIGDALELFVDTHDNKAARPFGLGDHQFWLVPQVEQKRVYVGRWKRAEEIPVTLYDIPGIQSAAKRTADGYILECLLPAAILQDFKPAAGTRLGLNLNLSIKGQQLDREVFWPRPKSDGVPDHPETWGTVILAP